MVKVNSNSILETIVALVIILAIFGISTSVFVQVTNTSMSITRLQAEQLLKTYAEQTEREQLFFNEQTERNRFRISRSASPSKDLPNLWQMRYAIYDFRDSLLSAWQSLVIIQ